MSTVSACVSRKPEAIHPSGIYRRRRPGRTVLYQVVQENIETYLSQARGEDPLGDAVPDYVEHDLRKYLKCGILAHGFARAFCDEYGHDFLIAFSCYPQQETIKSPQLGVRYLWDPPKDSLLIVSDRKARQ